MPLYLFFTKPKPLATVAPLLLPVARRFTLAAGHSLFGDLFLRDPATGEAKLADGPERRIRSSMMVG